MGLLLYPPQTSSLANFQRHICNYQKTTAVHSFRLLLVTHKNTKFVSHFAQTKHCFSLIVLLMSYEKHPLKTMLTYNLPWKSIFQSFSVLIKKGKYLSILVKIDWSNTQFDSLQEATYSGNGYVWVSRTLFLLSLFANGPLCDVYILLSIGFLGIKYWAGFY